MSSPDHDIITSIAPTGELRVAINYGNPVLAQRGADGQPGGVSAELARELASCLGIPLRIVTFDAAGKVFAALDEGQWDIAFLARDPLRAEKISFTAPYVIIEGTYIVAEHAPQRTVDDMDFQGSRIAVGKGAAYDLFLTRALEQAELVRAPTSEAAVELFVQEQLSAAAGVRQPLVRFAASNPGYRVLDGRFTTIEQAMAIPKGRTLAADYVSTFIEHQKGNGFVARALAESGQADAQVAPCL